MNDMSVNLKSNFGNLKLNLGCGNDYRVGFINVDSNKNHKADIYQDVTNLSDISNCSSDYVVAQDILEHLPRHKAKTALVEWNRVLTIGGIIEIRVPSLVDILKKIDSSASVEEHRDLIQALYGTQSYIGDFHLNGFTEISLSNLLHQCGFFVNEISVVQGTNLLAIAVKELHCEQSEFIRIPSDDRFINAVFEYYLKRCVDTSAKDYFKSVLDDGISREAVIDIIITSDEYKNLHNSQ